MSNVAPLLAVLAASVAGCGTTPWSEQTMPLDGPIQIERFRTRAGTSYFRMRNVSSGAVQYYHWFGQGDEPVAYCQYADQTVRPCSKVIYVDGDDYYIHERPIEPNKVVTFSAETKDAMAVGVLLWVNGHEQYVWSAIP